MSVTIAQIQRKPFTGSFSIENVFNTIRGDQSTRGIPVTVKVAPYLSRGVLQRWHNIRWASELRADVFHITGDIHYVALGLNRQKTILTIHDLDIVHRKQGLRTALLKLFWFYLPIRKCRYVTVISEATKRDLLDLLSINPEKVHVIPDTVCPAFQPRPKPFDTESPRILHVGGKANKNLPRLLTALDGFPCHLHLVGRFDARVEAELRSRQMSYTIESDLSAEQMMDAYCSSDIVSVVSTSEGFGMPIVEAQWVERVVITSNCSSMPEVAGDGAVFVDPFDTQSIRSGFESVRSDAQRRGRLIEAGRQNRKRFLARTVARQYEALYEHILRQRS